MNYVRQQWWDDYAFIVQSKFVFAFFIILRDKKSVQYWFFFLYTRVHTIKICLHCIVHDSHFYEFIIESWNCIQNKFLNELKYLNFGMKYSWNIFHILCHWFPDFVKWKRVPHIIKQGQTKIDLFFNDSRIFCGFYGTNVSMSVIVIKKMKKRNIKNWALENCANCKCKTKNV